MLIHQVSSYVQRIRRFEALQGHFLIALFFWRSVMKILIWAITGILALSGTLLVAVMAATVGWLSDNMAGGTDWVKQLGQVPVPAWLSSLVSPAWVEWLTTVSAGIINAVTTGLPWLAPMLGWIAPALWAVWLVVLIGLLAIASGLHYAVGRKTTQ